MAWRSFAASANPYKRGITRRKISGANASAATTAALVRPLPALCTLVPEHSGRLLDGGAADVSLNRPASMAQLRLGLQTVVAVLSDPPAALMDP